MDALTFLSKLIWPATLAVLLWPLRGPLAAKFWHLTKGKISKEGLTFEFEHHIQEVAVAVRDRASVEDKKGAIREILLDDLTEFERQTVVLLYYEDLSLQQTAHALDISESRVADLQKAIIRYIKLALKSRQE